MLRGRHEPSPAACSSARFGIASGSPSGERSRRLSAGNPGSGQTARQSSRRSRLPRSRIPRTARHRSPSPPSLSMNPRSPSRLLHDFLQQQRRARTRRRAPESWRRPRRVPASPPTAPGQHLAARVGEERLLHLRVEHLEMRRRCWLPAGTGAAPIRRRRGWSGSSARPASPAPRRTAVARGAASRVRALRPSSSTMRLASSSSPSIVQSDRLEKTRFDMLAAAARV